MKFHFTTLGYIKDIVQSQRAKKATGDIPEELKEIPCVYADALKDNSFSSFSSGYDAYLLDTYAGGGWLPKYNYPVRPLPYPFNLEKFITPTGAKEIFDDEFVGGFLSELISSQSQLNKFQKASLQVNYTLFNQWKEKKYAYLLSLSDYLRFSILPDKEDVTPRQMEAFWGSLKLIRNPVIFEIVADGRIDKIIYQFLCHEDDKTLVLNSLSQLFPHINRNGDDDDYLRNRIDTLEEWPENYNSTGVHLGLRGHYSFPLKTFTNFDPDPLNTIVGLIASVLDNEPKENYGAVIQMIVQPSRDIWENHLHTIELVGDEKLCADLRYRDFDDKLKYPLFGVVLRILLFVGGDVEEEELQKVSDHSFIPTGRSFSIFENPQEKNYPSISCFFSQDKGKPKIFNDIDGNLDPLEMFSVIAGNTYRMGFIVNSQELAGLAHFPTKAFNHPKLMRYEEPEEIIEVPEEFQQGEVLIGEHENGTKAYIPAEWRRSHTYVVGYTGMGKTTLLQNMIKQDMDAGRGVGVVDVKGSGQFIERVLSIVPEHRVDGVILFDLTDTDYPIGFNLLDVQDPQEKKQIKQRLMFILQRANPRTTWTDQMETLFLQSIDALVNDDETHSLQEIRTLIYNDAFRYKITNRIKDPYNQEYWKNEFEKTTESTKTAISRRLEDILSDVDSRAVLCQKRMAFNFKDIVNNNKIFLAKIPRGNFPITYRFFSRALMAQFEISVLSRKERTPFYLYVDEFQHFADDTIEEIINEAREAGLCLTISHQNTDQISDKILSACMSTGTTIVFQVQPSDARRLKPFFKRYSDDDILDLGKFYTLTRIGKVSDAFKMKTLPPTTQKQDFSEIIKQKTREKYCQKVEPIAEETEPGKPTESKEEVESDGPRESERKPKDEELF